MRYHVIEIGCGCLFAVAAAAADEGLWVEYREQVLPVLQQHCYPCHGDGQDKGAMSLDGFEELDDILGDDWTWELVQEQVGAHAMPPEGEPQPTPAQRRLITEWIDRVFHPIDCDNPDPGRVTLRRLNRVEYENTIRDLIGLGVRVSADFPPDDTGYGYDNIADVLSLSPMLMEKYLSAAESILDEALVTEPPAPPRHVYRERDLDGGQARDGLRALASNGEITAAHEVKQGGPMHIRVVAGADSAGDEPARMRITVDGEEAGVFDVEAPRGRPQPYDVEVRLEPGARRISAAFLNDYYNPEHPDPSRRDRNLYVARIVVNGPMDLPPPPMPESHRRIMIRQPGPDSPPEICAQEILAAFTRRAYRRPPLDWELDRLTALALDVIADGASFEEGIQAALQAVLVSPQFLFRSINPPPDAGEIFAIDEYALASRLSYFLWSSMPDDELLALADHGRLRDSLPEQLARMLRDPKAHALAKHFGGQWLQIRNLDLVDPAPDWFPTFDDQLRDAMAAETEAFFQYILREDRSILEFLDADYAFVNDRLAAHYGIPNVEGAEFRRVPLPDRRRGGLLGQAGILTVTSNPNRTSPVKRGKWVLENLLGTPPPPPPDDVPALPEPERGEHARSQRELLAEHRANPVCASCHTLMDPIGFAMEHYDGIGAWRDSDDGRPIDATGTLVTGESFDGMNDLRDLLYTVKREAFVRSLTRQLLTYALGRGPIPADRCAVDRIVEAAQQGDYRFSILLQGVVESVPFQQARRGEGFLLSDRR